MCVVEWKKIVNVVLTRNNGSQGIINWNLRKLTYGERASERAGGRTNETDRSDVQKTVDYLCFAKQSCVAKMNECAGKEHTCKYVCVCRFCIWYYIIYIFFRGEVAMIKNIIRRVFYMPKLISEWEENSYYMNLLLFRSVFFFFLQKCLVADSSRRNIEQF